MAKQRTVWTSEQQYALALKYERRALRAMVRRLLAAHLPYETVRRLCYQAASELVMSPSSMPAETPGLDFLASEALESIDTLIDEIVERPMKESP